MRSLVLAEAFMLASMSTSAAPIDCDALRAHAMICTDEERFAAIAGWADLVRSCGNSGTKTYYNAARAAWMDLVHAGCSNENDYVQIAKLSMEELDFSTGEAWIALAVSTADADAEPLYARLMWGEALFGLQKMDQARMQLVAASKGHDLDAIQELGSPESWRVENAAASRTLETYAELVKDYPSAAQSYRLAAAMVALKVGFAAAQRPTYNYEEAIAAFLHSDQLIPIQSQSVAIQMTVWRTLAIGHARLGNYAHAIEATEKLFALCHIDPPGPTPCPLNALIPLPLVRVVASPPLDTGEWYLIDQNMQTLGYVLSRAFVSISWDPTTGTLRSDAADTDFFGPLNADGYPNGRVSPEEDRVETEMVPIAGGTQQTRCACAGGRFEPLVKKFVTNLAAAIWWGTLEADDDPVFFGRRLKDFEIEITRAHAQGKVAPSTWEAFQAGLHAHHLLLTLIDRVNERFYTKQQP